MSDDEGLISTVRIQDLPGEPEPIIPSDAEPDPPAPPLASLRPADTLPEGGGDGPEIIFLGGRDIDLFSPEPVPAQIPRDGSGQPPGPTRPPASPPEKPDIIPATDSMAPGTWQNLAEEPRARPNTTVQRSAKGLTSERCPATSRESTPTSRIRRSKAIPDRHYSTWSSGKVPEKRPPSFTVLYLGEGNIGLCRPSADAHPIESTDSAEALSSEGTRPEDSISDAASVADSEPALNSDVATDRLDSDQKDSEPPQLIEVDSTDPSLESDAAEPDGHTSRRIRADASTKQGEISVNNYDRNTPTKFTGRGTVLALRALGIPRHPAGRVFHAVAQGGRSVWRGSGR
jgi:hypothetical protein